MHCHCLPTLVPTLVPALVPTLVPHNRGRYRSVPGCHGRMHSRSFLCNREIVRNKDLVLRGASTARGLPERTFVGDEAGDGGSLKNGSRRVERILVSIGGDTSIGRGIGTSTSTGGSVIDTGIGDTSGMAAVAVLLLLVVVVVLGELDRPRLLPNDSLQRVPGSQRARDLPYGNYQDEHQIRLRGEGGEREEGYCVQTLSQAICSTIS